MITKQAVFIYYYQPIELKDEVEFKLGITVVFSFILFAATIDLHLLIVVNV